MTLTFHMGVIDVPYVENEGPKRMAARLAKNAKKPPSLRRHAAPEHKTTGDVATILEAKYGIMNAFYETNEIGIVEDLTEGLRDGLENILAGGPPTIDPFGGACSKIEEKFKTFLSSREAERVGIPGTPTEAARKGVNHRMKHPYAKANKRRPSFVDTSLYMSSEKTWVD